MHLKKPNLTHEELQYLLDAALFRSCTNVSIDCNVVEEKEIIKGILTKFGSTGWKSSNHVYLFGDMFEEQEEYIAKTMLNYKLIEQKGIKKDA